MNPYHNKFLTFFWGATIFKKFLLCKCFLCKLFTYKNLKSGLNYWQIPLTKNKAQRDCIRVSELAAWFLRLWPFVFVKKKFMYFLFCFHLLTFCSPMTYCPKSKIQFFQEKLLRPNTSFNCYLMSVMTLNLLVLRKHRLIFELCFYFIFFLSTSRAVWVKTGDI